VFNEQQAMPKQYPLSSMLTILLLLEKVFF